MFNQHQGQYGGSQYGSPAPPPPSYNGTPPMQQQPPFPKPTRTPDAFGHDPYQQSSTQYAPPPGPPPPNQPQPYGSPYNSTPSPPPRAVYQDVWASTLFWVLQAGFLLTAVLGCRWLSLQPRDSRAPGAGQGGQYTTFWSLPGSTVAAMFGTAIGVAAVFSGFYLWLMLRHPSPMIHITYWLTIVLTAAMTVGYAVTFSLGAALLSGILTVLLVMTYFAIRSRIPFAAALLESVTATAVRFNGTLIAALVGLLVSGAYSALWIASVVGVEGYMAGERGRGGFGVWLLLAGMILLLLWTLEVIRNTVAVTVSGTFASVYFGGVEVHDPDGGGRVTVQVPGEKGKSVTAGAAKRAMTTSFGSVCFASLLVALLQALRGAVRVAEQDSQGNICMMCLTWCCQCILGIIQGMLEYFNKFAFTQVAIYGKGYVQAAKDTWNMIKYRGFDAVINTSLVGNVLSIGSLFCGLCCGLFGWLLAIDGGAATDSSYLSRALFICIASAVIGTWVFLIVIEVINAGVATTYVCLAMEPGVIRNKQPALFDKFARTYPQIMTGV